MTADTEPLANGNDGNPDLASIVAELGGLCPDCRRFICECAELAHHRRPRPDDDRPAA